jgi:carboxypeptidase Taq
MQHYPRLQALFDEITQLDRLLSLAHWDEATMMPTGSGKARAEAVGTLCSIKHQKLTEEHVGDLINNAQSESDLSQWQLKNLELIRRQYQNATCLPVELVKALSEKATLCEQAWRTGRAANDWKSFEPKLAELFKLVKESATIRGEIFGINSYDVCLDDFSPNLTQEIIDPVFDKLKSVLPDLVNRVIEHQSQFSTKPFEGTFGIDKQRSLGLEVMKHIGFDFHYGRLDTSHHPFCGGFSEDVRITTRYDEADFLSSLLAVCHETGHACYEQGLPKDWGLQPVGAALGMSVHESQSLIVEMPACRSLEFMTFLTPLAIETFGMQNAFTPENLHQLCTKVEKSLIRVEADEVTYPLHIILRYEIERDLFNGSLSISDLPDAWHDKMSAYFGLSTKGNDKDGVMQDVHWPSAAFGYFPAYTFGRLIAQQLFNKAVEANNDLKAELQHGNFKPLMNWLNTNIHAKGSLLTMNDLLVEATGELLNPAYFLDYIENNYL